MLQSGLPIAVVRFEQAQFAVRGWLFSIAGKRHLQESSGFIALTLRDMRSGKANESRGQSRLFSKSLFVAVNRGRHIPLRSFQVAVSGKQQPVVGSSLEGRPENFLCCIEIFQPQ